MNGVGASLRSARRVVITGPRGAGKTTFARELATVIDLPLYHLDSVLMKPGWEKLEGPAARSAIRDLCSKEEWIIEGHADYMCRKGTYDIRLRRAEVVILLDYSPLTCWHRLLWRRLRGADRHREGMPPGFTEKLPPGFLWRVLMYPFRERQVIFEKIAQYAGGFELFVFRDPRAVESLLATI